jgi:hypothetical protein
LFTYLRLGLPSGLFPSGFPTNIPVRAPYPAHLIVNMIFFDYGTLVQILRFWTISNVLSLFKSSSCLSFKIQRFGNWILSPSSGKTYSVGSNWQSYRIQCVFWKIKRTNF